uniref:Uncharacterized protein n=1 Tax=Arundo donax TaxID=35708 RepID=A0A0A8ZK56_ARUDO
MLVLTRTGGSIISEREKKSIKKERESIWKLGFFGKRTATKLVRRECPAGSGTRA